MPCKNFFWILLLLLPILGTGQTVAKLLEKGDTQFEEKAYAYAIDTYEVALQKSRNYDEDALIRARLNLATSYFFVKDFGKAEANFRDVLTQNVVLENNDLIAYLRFAQTLSSNGKHAESAKIYEKYTSLQEQDKRGREFAKLYNNLEALTRNAGSYRIDYLGLNTGNPDFSPMYYKDGLVFVSGRDKTSGVKRVFNWDNSSFLDLFFIEDLAVLGKQGSSSAIGSGDALEEVIPTPLQHKVGSDRSTSSTPNDANIIASIGSENITGSTDYVEYATVPAKRFSRTLNSKYHEGPCTFYHTEEKVIFTRNNQSISRLLGRKNSDVNRLKLYTAIKQGNEWRKITEMPFNSDEYSCGHPTLTVNDKLLYFVSDMPGGFGGADIYLTRFINGEWSKPENLGGSVNTQGNEMFPYIDDLGNLYFSTDGSPGLGGLDIFFISMNTITGMPTGRSRNLGAPLNSNNDDFGILTDSERKFGYFSSNRKRGNSDDDIYTFERLGPMYGCRELIVNVFDENTKKPIPDVRFRYTNVRKPLISENAIASKSGSIKLCLEADNEFSFSYNESAYLPLIKTFSNFDASDYEPAELNIYLKPEMPENKTLKNESQQMVVVQRGKSLLKTFKGVITGGEDGRPIAGVKLKFKNLCSGLSQEFITRKDGSYEFERDTNCDYELSALKNNYASSTEIISKIVNERSLLIRIFNSPKAVKVNVPNYSGGSLFDTKLYRVGDIVNLNSIYYEPDDWKLNKIAMRELDRLIATLDRYPNMIVEMRSHTDTRGNADANMALSKKRVAEVMGYLEKRNLDVRRIRGVGMGETQPVNKCGDGVQCTETEHQQNRRTEFKILQIEKM